MLRGDSVHSLVLALFVCIDIKVLYVKLSNVNERAAAGLPTHSRTHAWLLVCYATIALTSCLY